jgi:hypothetical protein
MAKPLRCLLRLHSWDVRENPETGAHYQVCVRCNAYRDRGNAAFDGRGAGVSVVEPPRRFRRLVGSERESFTVAVASRMLTQCTHVIRLGL